MPRVCRTSLGRFQSARKLLELWASPCACAWSDLKCPKVPGTFSLRSNAFKRIASLPRVCRTSLVRFQSARKLLELSASPCACAWSGLKCPKVPGTFSLRSNAWKRIASLPRVCRTSLGRFRSARKLLELWAFPCACAWSDLKPPKVPGPFSLGSNACKRIPRLPSVWRTSLGRFQSARKLLELWAYPCACAWCDLKCPKVPGTFSLRSNACKRIASLPRVCRTSLGRFQSARKLLELWDSPFACAWSDLKPPKVPGTFSLGSNACKRIPRLPRVWRTSLGRFQSARKLLELWDSPCACAWSDLKPPKVPGTFSSGSNACKQIPRLRRVLRTSLGRFQSARKLLELWDSPCACAWSDLKPPKVPGTFSLGSNACKRIPRLPRVWRTSLGRFQSARKLLELWAYPCACAWSDLKCPKVPGTFSLRSNACKRIASLPRVCKTSLGRFQSSRKLVELWASSCACAWFDLKCPNVPGTFSLRSNACKRIASLPRVWRTSLGRFQSARKLLELWASPCACAWSDLKCPKVPGTFILRSNACKRIASLPRVCRTSLGRFQSARKLLELSASPCACAWSDLKCPKV